MINVEVWLSGKGTEPVWAGKMPAIPSVGDRMDLAVESGYQGTVWRVTWVTGHWSLVKVRITLDDWVHTT